LAYAFFTDIKKNWRNLLVIDFFAVIWIIIIRNSENTSLEARINLYKNPKIIKLSFLGFLNAEN